MFTLDSIVTRIATETGYAVEIAREEQVSLPAMSILPTVYVGYLAEKPAHEVSPYNERDLEGLAGYDEITMDSISIQIITTMENLISHKNTVKNALLGWSPTSTNNELSGFTSLGGSVFALNNGRVHWGHEFGITYPTL